MESKEICMAEWMIKGTDLKEDATDRDFKSLNLIAGIRT